MRKDAKRADGKERRRDYSRRKYDDDVSNVERAGRLPFDRPSNET